MNTLKLHINSINHIIVLSNIKMYQNSFSYNSITFEKVDDNTVDVIYQKQTTEDTQRGIDCNLTWAINDIFKVLNEYSKAGHNPYNNDYKMFDFNL